MKIILTSRWKVGTFEVKREESTDDSALCAILCKSIYTITAALPWKMSLGYLWKVG